MERCRKHTKLFVAQNPASRLRLMICVFLLAGMMSSCNDWLDILPNNEQVTDNYWKSKEDVEAVIASGYYYLRQAVPSFIIWGEVRGGTIYTTNTAAAYLQNFNITPSNTVCNYASVYKVIGMANSVLKYAPSVMTEDDTYYASIMNSHLCEAYFLRAYCYLLLVKNYRDVPLVVEAYVNDDAEYSTPKSTEAEIIAQVKQDVKDAIATGAAKTEYEDTDGLYWTSKGRATRWALYALMADACLWNHDYDECIQYCNNILDVEENDFSNRPRFISNPSQWFEIFYPGNSNESIFEVQWESSSKYAQSNNYGSLFAINASSVYKYTDYAVGKLIEETDEALANTVDREGRIGRMLYCSYKSLATNQLDYAKQSQLFVWKYKGTDVVAGDPRPQEDANFILYRVAEIILMKAEALIMKGESSWASAVELINTIRRRASLNDLDIVVEETDEKTMLEAVMHEREMEFLAEGKRWYDLLRVARYDHGDGVYRQWFVDEVVEGNQTTKDEWIRSVLLDENAWYMPIPYSEIEINPELVQNPYYGTTK